MIKNESLNVRMEKVLHDYKVLRTCPPPFVLLSKAPPPEVNEHIKKCQSCSKIRESLGSMTIKEPLRGEKQQKCVPGQLWGLSPLLGGWTKDAYYYNPPLVLVLLSNNNIVTVAQTYDNDLLRCPGDVPLDVPMSGFAEPWNVYTLHSSALKTHWTTVEMAVVFQVLLMMKHKFGDSLNEYQKQFRQMETDIGQVIAAQSQKVLLEELLDGRDTVYANVSGSELYEHHYDEDIGSRLEVVLGGGDLRIYRPVSRGTIESVTRELLECVNKYANGDLLTQLWNIVRGSTFIQRSHGIADFVWNAPAHFLKVLQNIVVPPDKDMPHPSMLGGGIYRGRDEQRKEKKGEDEQIKKDIYLKFNEILKKEGITWYPIHESISEEKFLVIGLRHRDKENFEEEKDDKVSPPEIILQTEGFDADSWKIDDLRWSNNWLRVDIEHKNVISLDAVKIKVRGDSNDSRITLTLEKQDPS